MPFLRDMARRAALDAIVFLMEKLEVKADGDLNYVLYKFAKRNVAVRYNDLKNFCGELHEAECQIRADILLPYERELKKEYGDV
jgi:hypothetical protein